MIQKKGNAPKVSIMPDESLLSGLKKSHRLREATVGNVDRSLRDRDFRLRSNRPTLWAVKRMD